MATITAYTSSVQGEFLDVLDPNTWNGGVVPGPADTAVFPDAPYTVTNETYNNTPGHAYYTAPYTREIIMDFTVSCFYIYPLR